MMKQTPITLMVIPINDKRLVRLITALVPHKKNETFKISAGALVIAGANNGELKKEPIVTDTECIYQFAEKRYHNGYVNFVYDVPVRIKIRTKNGYTHPMYPQFYFPVTVNELLDKYCLKPTNLKTFMGSRFDYNPRIISNTSNFLKIINTAE